MRPIARWCGRAAALVLFGGLSACTDGLMPEYEGSTVRPSFAPGGRGGGPKPEPESMIVELLAEVRPGVPSDLSGDGSNVYVDDDCGVRAEAMNSLWFRPVDGGLNRKQVRELEASGCGFPRVGYWDLASAKVHLSPDHSADVSLESYWMSGSVDEPTPGDNELLTTSLGQWGQWGPNVEHDGIFNLEYCLDGGVGPPIRFIEDAILGTNRLEVAESGGVVTVRTQAEPNNVGWCLHTRSDGTEVALLLHANLAYTVRPRP